MKAARTDYHIHPNYSIDASPVSIKEYCYKAIELGLVDICFTTHLELDPVRKEIDNYAVLNGEKVSVYNYAWLDNYFYEITRAQKEFRADGLKVKAGIEIGYCRGTEKDIEKIIDNYPFDFVLGAIHCIDHIAISSKKESPQYFQSRSLSQVRADYFSILREMVESGLFDSIAHIDLYRRYGISQFGSKILTIHRGAIEPIFMEMARRGMGLEINTSSLRRGLKEFHPSREIVALAAKSGVKIFTIGSDAHSLEQLGEYIDEAHALLEEYNLVNHVYSRRRAILFT
ncbi:MAG: histidinol-phosphatase [Dethiobacteria bacterium]|jgi:histidinol-phosphatase (PHP family)